MLNTDWSKLTPQQLGAYGENYAKMTFLSYGMDIYPPVVDDHAVDLVVKGKNHCFYEIQIKSLYKGKYSFIKKSMMLDETTRKVKNNYFVFLIHFIQNEEPETYLIPGSAWNNPDGVLLVSRDYPNGKSKPEFGINITNKSMPLLQQYKVTDKLLNKYFE